MKLITYAAAIALAGAMISPVFAFWENTPLDTRTWETFEEDLRDTTDWNGNSFVNTLDIYNECYKEDYIDVEVEYSDSGNWYTENFRIFAGGALEDLQYGERYVYVSGEGEERYYWDEHEIDFGAVKSSRWFEFYCD